MRAPFVVLLVVLLGACASSPSDRFGDWRARQLAKAAEASVTAQVAAVVVPDRQDPQPQQPQPQAPRRYIDQIEPPRQQPEGERRFGTDLHGLDSSRDVTATLAPGRVSFRAGGTQYHAGTNALFLQLATEPAPRVFQGAGLTFSGFVSENDLFRGQTISDGDSVRGADARAYGFDFFPHLTVHPTRGDVFDTTIETGVFLDWFRLDHQLADVGRDLLGFGGRIALEPEWRMLRGDRYYLSAFARVAGDFGGAQFLETWRFGSGSDTTTRWSLETGAGLRLSYDTLFGELAFRQRHIDFGGVRSGLFGNVDDMDIRTQGLFLTVGGRF
jgi:hypothetical protein